MTINISTSNDQGISLSDSAISHIKKQLRVQQEHSAVRLSIVKTGCSGYAYEFQFVSEATPKDKTYQIAGINIYIDHKSYPYLKGTYVDYVKQGLNYKFVYTNPNQTGECGCGESFTVDKKFSS